MTELPPVHELLHESPVACCETAIVAGLNPSVLLWQVSLAPVGLRVASLPLHVASPLHVIVPLHGWCCEQASTAGVGTGVIVSSRGHPLRVGEWVLAPLRALGVG